MPTRDRPDTTRPAPTTPPVHRRRRVLAALAVACACLPVFGGVPHVAGAALAPTAAVDSHVDDPGDDATHPAGAAVPLPARVTMPPEDWLGAVGHYRAASGLGPVAEEPSWTAGLEAHLAYLANTPDSLRTGPYANAHTQNPDSPWFSVEGRAAGESSNLSFWSGGRRSERDAIESWMVAPFHAIGILRPGLTRAAFAMDADGNAGLDVARGAASGGTHPVLFPGAGATNFLHDFRGELPDPTEPCGPGYSDAGLPLFALLAEPPPPSTTATLTLPSGRVIAEGAELCVVTADTFTSSDPVYGETGRAILRNDNAVLVIPRRRLVSGVHHVALDAGTRIEWSFRQVSPFDDVPRHSVYAPAVRWLGANAITAGVTPTRYLPAAPVTRGQMGSFLWRFAGAPDTTTTAFRDVPLTSTHGPAVSWLASRGIATGGDDGGFRPGAPVTRGQMAAFLWRLAGSPAPAGRAGFVDVARDAYYADAVAWLAGAGVTTGTSGGSRYEPSAPVSRGQMALFLRRVDSALR